MSGSIPLLPQYASMAWCSVKAQGQLYLYFTFHDLYHVVTALGCTVQRRRLV